MDEAWEKQAFIGWVGSVLDVTNYLVSREVTPALTKLRQELALDVVNMDKAKEPQPKLTLVVVYIKHFQSWERAEVVNHIFKKGKLLHLVYLVDRGAHTYTHQIHLPTPEQLRIKELPPTAVLVNLIGLKPAPQSDSTDGTADVWCEEARELATNTVSKKVIVKVIDSQTSGFLFGEMYVRKTGEKGYWSVSETLLRRGWALKDDKANQDILKQSVKGKSNMSGREKEVKEEEEDVNAAMKNLGLGHSMGVQRRGRIRRGLPGRGGPTQRRLGSEYY